MTGEPSQSTSTSRSKEWTAFDGPALASSEPVGRDGVAFPNAVILAATAGKNWMISDSV